MPEVVPKLAKHTLIIAEKPDAAARIASALDVNEKPRRLLDHGVPYFEAHRGKSLIVVPALGHLYSVAGEKTGKSDYPVFKYRWVPLYMAKRSAKRTRVWLETIAKLAQNADAFVDACDYDLEGSIIGYTVLKYACGGKDAVAKRMKYSTLTREELEESYAHLLPSLDFSLIEAGLARHEVDWLYGVNLSRALTQAAKKHSGRYATLSTGRVQGPTLKFLATREKSIRNFVPTPYWTVKATVCIADSLFEIPHEKNVIKTKDEADDIVEACKGKKGKIAQTETHKLLIPPPPPFDLGALQNEAYRLFKYTPMFTSKVTQRLYLDALISYPRTSSQKLPPTIGYRNILQKLARNREYGELASELLAKPSLKPKEGRGFDTAHPAIYPTGKLPESAFDRAQSNVWSLVIKRFMAAFADNAVQQTVKVIIDIGGNKFQVDGKETWEEGWLHFYKPYAHVFDAPLPCLVEGQEIDVKKVVATEEFTKPPSRYNPSTLLKRMQQANLGTKATRAGIIQTLYDRKYISEERIVVTDLGFEVVDVLQKHCPTVLSSMLTAELEERMNEIQEKKVTREEVLDEAIAILKPVTAKLKEKEYILGEQLSRALGKSKLDERTVGECPSCKTGKLLIIRSKKTGKRFVGCTNYFQGACKTSFPLPQRGVVKPLRAKCKSCGYPMVGVWQKGKHSWKLCLNRNCLLKKNAMRGIDSRGAGS
jgi:DNA topoisomerase I